GPGTPPTGARRTALSYRVDLCHGWRIRGGGSGNPPIQTTVGNRVDIQAQAAWQLRNLGYGNRATVREREAQYVQANLSVAETGARVGSEVTTAAQDVRVLEETISIAEAAVK